jgi:protoporphyrinogen oxidase
VGLKTQGALITRAVVRDLETGEDRTVEADYFFSTMPVRELVSILDVEPPPEVRRIAEGLQYRDFLTVGLLVRGLEQPLPDNWIYIQEPDVRVGRLQVFNNWSPFLVRDPATTWLGLEYFCFENDDLWNRPDAEMIAFATSEMVRLGLVRAEDVVDACVVRMEKTYPAYFGTYPEFDQLRAWLDRFENLFLIGRNGMHKYNNQDHSMLTAMTSVDNIAARRTDKSNIWAVNTEQEYHESR